MIYTYQNKQFIKSDLSTVWNYFNDPKHIRELTPPTMRLHTLSENLTNEIYTNQVISYTVSPIFGISLQWETEIICIKNHKKYIDIQKKGPYKKWHHVHLFEEKENGILMTDLVTYELPYGWIGDIVHFILVKKKIKSLFNYRTKQINKKFENEERKNSPILVSS